MPFGDCCAEWKNCSEVESFQGPYGEAWGLKGVHFPPYHVLELYRSGESPAVIARRFTGWSPQQVQAILDFARDRMPELVQRDRVETLDWSGCAEIEQVPGKCSGAPILKGTRVFAQGVWSNYADGFTVPEIAEMFCLERKQIHAVIDYALTQ